MGCQEFDNDGSVNYTWQGNWLEFANEWFTDESINDTSLGCEWWVRSIPVRWSWMSPSSDVIT